LEETRGKKKEKATWELRFADKKKKKQKGGNPEGSIRIVRGVLRLKKKRASRGRGQERRKKIVSPEGQNLNGQRTTQERVVYGDSDKRVWYDPSSCPKGKVGRTRGG